MIYGMGRGLQPNSDQLPKLAALSKQLGAGVYFGKGLNRYLNVHIDDLVACTCWLWIELPEALSFCAVLVLEIETAAFGYPRHALTATAMAFVAFERPGSDVVGSCQNVPQTRLKGASTQSWSGPISSEWD